MICLKEFDFDAAHFLPNYNGKCEHLHGHTYKLVVKVEGTPDHEGMVLDFVRFKNLVKELVVSKAGPRLHQRHPASAVGGKILPSGSGNSWKRRFMGRTTIFLKWKSGKRRRAGLSIEVKHAKRRTRPSRPAPYCTETSGHPRYPLAHYLKGSP